MLLELKLLAHSVDLMVINRDSQPEQLLRVKNAAMMKAKVAQCPTLCGPVDYAVHGIL